MLAFCCTIFDAYLRFPFVFKKFVKNLVLDQSAYTLIYLLFQEIPAIPHKSNFFV